MGYAHFRWVTFHVIVRALEILEPRATVLPLCDMLHIISHCSECPHQPRHRPLKSTTVTSQGLTACHILSPNTTRGSCVTAWFPIFQGVALWDAGLPAHHHHWFSTAIRSRTAIPGSLVRGRHSARAHTAGPSPQSRGDASSSGGLCSCTYPGTSLIPTQSPKYSAGAHQ